MTSFMCELRGHKYSARQLRQSKESCEEFEVCTRCKYVHTVSSNYHSIFNLSSHTNELKSQDACVYMVKCKVCSQFLGEITIHLPEDAEWLYSSENGCEQVLHCRRCNEFLTDKRVVHSPGPWQFASDDSCVYLQRCTRCNEVIDTNKQVTHSKEHVSTYTVCEEVIRCRRCNKVLEEKIISPHDWQYDRTETEHGARGLVETRDYKKCSKCGKEDYDYDYSDDSDRTW